MLNARVLSNLKPTLKFDRVSPHAKEVIILPARKLPIQCKNTDKILEYYTKSVSQTPFFFFTSNFAQVHIF